MFVISMIVILKQTKIYLVKLLAAKYKRINKCNMQYRNNKYLTVIKIQKTNGKVRSDCIMFRYITID
jgi:hypothetical protein